jgi:hypothetical protein
MGLLDAGNVARILGGCAGAAIIGIDRTDPGIPQRLNAGVAVLGGV